ncbi:hypothetical protein [Sorangium cellulosum]|uniref:Uncharacterized protein n=1 Tax=Sorangium cellulosum TaxID=56 RepID=A0A150TDY1_SORCE|nr:hypothetical protein BE20_35555 [Sorangium cellulosum]KYG02914.1 hypothetical protein BE18_46935 [Sorangium cellulosum]
MQKSTCTASAHASGDGTPAVKLVHRASSATSAARSLVVEGGVSVGLLAGLAIPALVSLVDVVGLIRVGNGCGPPL